jgi:hypothetical protein
MLYQLSYSRAEMDDTTQASEAQGDSGTVEAMAAVPDSLSAGWSRGVVAI